LFDLNDVECHRTVRLRHIHQIYVINLVLVAVMLLDKFPETLVARNFSAALVTPENECFGTRFGSSFWSLLPLARILIFTVRRQCNNFIFRNDELSTLGRLRIFDAHSLDVFDKSRRALPVVNFVVCQAINPDPAVTESPLEST